MYQKFYNVQRTENENENISVFICSYSNVVPVYIQERQTGYSTNRDSNQINSNVIK